MSEIIKPNEDGQSSFTDQEMNDIWSNLFANLQENVNVSNEQSRVSIELDLEWWPNKFVHVIDEDGCEYVFVSPVSKYDQHVDIVSAFEKELNKTFQCLWGGYAIDNHNSSISLTGYSWAYWPANNERVASLIENSDSDMQVDYYHSEDEVLTEKEEKLLEDLEKEGILCPMNGKKMLTLDIPAISAEELQNRMSLMWFRIGWISRAVDQWAVFSAWKKRCVFLSLNTEKYANFEDFYALLHKHWLRFDNDEEFLYAATLVGDALYDSDQKIWIWNAHHNMTIEPPLPGPMRGHPFPSIEYRWELDRSYRYKYDDKNILVIRSDTWQRMVRSSDSYKKMMMCVIDDQESVSPKKNIEFFG